MVKVSVLYPNGAGTKFDMTYYLNQHIPMVRRLLGSALKGVTVEHGISGEEPGSLAPYIATGHIDSVQTFQASFAQQHRRSWQTSRTTQTPSRSFRSVKSSSSIMTAESWPF
jgi:uncharacterized protein (TIGR02118 family)